MQNLVVVAGGGGFIGGHLVADLVREGTDVRAVDVKPPEDWYQRPKGAQVMQLDLRHADACREAVQHATRVYNLAAVWVGWGS
jgi:nucleoside-diphosphate-sugar epimerase